MRVEFSLSAGITEKKHIQSECSRLVATTKRDDKTLACFLELG